MADIQQAIRSTLAERAMAVANRRPWRSAALAGLGGAITIAPLAAVQLSDLAASLIPPFGASCVLVFGAPASPFCAPA